MERWYNTLTDSICGTDLGPEFVAAVFRLINAEKMDQRRAEMDAYVVLTNCVLNTAIIQLFQRRTTRPQSVEQLVDPWAFANNRCVYACENTAFKIRQMDEEELLLCNPHLIFSVSRNIRETA